MNVPIHRAAIAQCDIESAPEGSQRLEGEVPTLVEQHLRGCAAGAA